MNKIEATTIARTIILALALINQVLTTTGHSVIPIDDETVNQFISLGFTIVTALIAFWKNNSFTQKALEADKKLRELKADDTLEDD